MSAQYYNKLIRDNVPAIMDAKGVTYEVRALGQEEFSRALLRKASEEAAELTAAKDRAEVVAEMGDLLDVIDAIRAEYRIADEELATLRAAQMEKKGGFDQRLFLLWSEDK